MPPERRKLDAPDQTPFERVGNSALAIERQHLTLNAAKTDHLELLTTYILRHPTVQKLSPGLEPDKELDDEAQDVLLQTIIAEFPILFTEINPHAVQLMALTQQYGQVASLKEDDCILNGFHINRICGEAAFRTQALTVENHQSPGALWEGPMHTANGPKAISTTGQGLSIKATHTQGTSKNVWKPMGQNLRVDQLSVNLDIELTVKEYDPNAYTDLQSEQNQHLSLENIISEIKSGTNECSITSDHLTLMIATSLEGAHTLTSQRTSQEGSYDSDAVLWAPLTPDQLHAQIDRATTLLGGMMTTMPGLQNLLTEYGYSDIHDLFDADFKRQWMDHATNSQLHFDTIRKNQENDPTLKTKQKLLLFISRCYIAHPTQQEHLNRVLTSFTGSKTTKDFIDTDKIPWQDFAEEETSIESDVREPQTDHPAAGGAEQQAEQPRT